MLTVLPDPEQAEEAVQTFNAFAEVLKSLNFQRILAILILLGACIVVMKVLLRLLDRSFQRLEVEKSLHTFVRAALRVVLWLITLCLVLSYMGIEMTSIIAVLSVLGLALSLAIQGALSNLAGGIQLLVSKPFKADDYIDAGEISGTVIAVGLVYTQLRTIDNKIIFIPNGTIAGQTITNYNTQVQRRVDLKFTVSYEDEAEKVIACIRSVIAAGTAAGIPVGMCGEAAADPLLIPLWISFGLTEYSVGPASILATRAAIAGWSHEEARALAEAVMGAVTPDAVLDLLKAAAR